MEYLQALIDMQLVPVEWWPVVGRWLSYGLAALVTVNALLALADRVDMLDGRRDWAWLAKMHAGAVVALSFAQALLEMLPVQVPIVRGLKRLRDIKRAQEMDS